MKPFGVTLNIMFRKIKKIKGCYWTDGKDGNPLIWINRTSPQKAIIDTLYHEFTHFALELFASERSEVVREDEKVDNLNVVCEDKICYEVAKAVMEVFDKYLKKGMIINREYSKKEARKWMKGKVGRNK